MNADKLQTAVVIGAGTMGAGIAGLLARAGCEVRLVDQSASLLDRGMTALRGAQDSLRTARMLSARDAQAALRRIELGTDVEAACRGVQLAIEAIAENLEAKLQLFRRLDAACPRRAVLASNTSGLSIGALAQVTQRPQRVAGMHFWNPPHVVPLVEVIQAEATAPSTAKFLHGVCRRLGKRPILVRKDIPGFVGNRLQFAVFREALHLLASGVASAEDIDTAMTAGPGLRYGLLGPLQTADLGGLDVFLAISRYLFAQLDAKDQAPALLADLVARGRCGAKTGGGFYDYAPGQVPKLLARRDRILLEYLQSLQGEEE